MLPISNFISTLLHQYSINNFHFHPYLYQCYRRELFIATMGVLEDLRKVTAAGGTLTFYRDNEPVDGIKDATDVDIGGTKHPLDATTNFYNDDAPQLLRAVVFCWLHNDALIVDYKNACAELGIPDFKFLVKTELATYLLGKLDACAFIKEDAADTTGKTDQLRDPQLERILANERELVDHNQALRGLKNIDFGYLISDAKKFAKLLKRAKPQLAPTNGKRSKSNLKPPIIIVSPATTALLQLSNVKAFLEDGAFVEPGHRPDTNLIMVSHPLEHLVSAAHKIMVVDNVDLFTKPEYWDRVCAIFTTGQAWQFSKYKYAQPEQLFQHYPGFHLGYLGEPAPAALASWNVREIKVDRGDKRFRDKMIVRDFWSDLEKILIARGYGK